MKKMTTVEALRTCLYEDGIEMLLDYPKLRGKLWDLAPAEILGRERFRAIYESGAVEFIREAVIDVANYEKNFEKALEKLSAVDCMTAGIAKETLGLFYDALGFPSKSETKTQTIMKDDWKYIGEVSEGQPHGRGREVLLMDGIEYSSRDGQWLCGSPFGYFHSIDSLGVESYSFCIDGWTIGKETRIWSEDDIEVIDHGFDIEKIKPKKPVLNIKSDTHSKDTHQSLANALNAIMNGRKE